MLSFYLMAELANAKSLSGLFGKLRIGKFSLMIHFVSYCISFFIFCGHNTSKLLTDVYQSILYQNTFRVMRLQITM